MQQFYRANGYLSMAKDRITFAKSIDADHALQDAYGHCGNGRGRCEDRPGREGLPEEHRSLQVRNRGVGEHRTGREDAASGNAPAHGAGAHAAVLYGAVAFPRDASGGLRVPSSTTILEVELLYDANKDLLADPKNPDIIEPGMRFLIPSLGSETRDGDFVRKRSTRPGAK